MGAGVRAGAEAEICVMGARAGRGGQRGLADKRWAACKIWSQLDDHCSLYAGHDACYCLHGLPPSCSFVRHQTHQPAQTHQLPAPPLSTICSLPACLPSCHLYLPSACLPACPCWCLLPCSPPYFACVPPLPPGPPQPSGQPVEGCWFCLGSSKVDINLVASVGQEAYLAVDKGVWCVGGDRRSKRTTKVCGVCVVCVGGREWLRRTWL